MTFIFFIAAVLFAIPTFGISLLAFLGYVVLGGVLKGKERAGLASERRHKRHMNETGKEIIALKGNMNGPSWAQDYSTQLKFAQGMINILGQKGIPEAYLNFATGVPEFSHGLMIMAGGMERKGSTLVEQQAAAALLVEIAWDRLPVQYQNQAMDCQRQRRAFSVDLATAGFS